MNVRVLAIALAGQPWGHLFQYGDLCRFVARPGLPAEGPVLSLSMLAADARAQSQLWADVKNPLFNAQGGLLPAWFQNLLPEGVLRAHLAQLRGCAEDDHFELLAACGSDLPGAVRAQPVEVDRATLQRLVTQDQDALEMSVVAEPLAQGISVSGVQPKLGLQKQGGKYVAPGHGSGRYVARSRTGRGLRIIAKLPVPNQPGLPLLEMTSLQLARAAGVTTCDAELAPLAAIDAEHGYALPDEPHFLAVRRFDRDGARRIHFEDFAQILATDPQHKYRGSYRDMALALRAFPSLGDAAVLELLRRITVNELLGNPDAHLKNFGILYPDGRTPQLAPAYDVVAYAALYGVEGHALPLLDAGAPRGPLLTPHTLRAFCRAVGTAEPLARRTIADTVAAARERWPALLGESALPAVWRDRLTERLAAHPLVQPLARRAARQAAA